MNNKFLTLKENSWNINICFCDCYHEFDGKLKIIYKFIDKFLGEHLSYINYKLVDSDQGTYHDHDKYFKTKTYGYMIKGDSKKYKIQVNHSGLFVNKWHYEINSFSILFNEYSKKQRRKLKPVLLTNDMEVCNLSDMNVKYVNIDNINEIKTYIKSLEIYRAIQILLTYLPINHFQSGK